jgi:hypothetical protein
MVIDLQGIIVSFEFKLIAHDSSRPKTRTRKKSLSIYGDEESQSVTVFAMFRRARAFAERAGRLLEGTSAGELEGCSGESSDIGPGVGGESVGAGWRPAPNGR